MCHDCYRAMLCYAMICYAMLCYAMPCYAMLCYAMLCYAIYAMPLAPAHRQAVEVDKYELAARAPPQIGRLDVRVRPPVPPQERERLAQLRVHGLWRQRAAASLIDERGAEERHAVDLRDAAAELNRHVFQRSDVRARRQRRLRKPSWHSIA